MKKQFLLSAFALMFTIGSVFAQEARQMPTPEQRVESTLEKMAPLNLTAEQTPKVKAVLTNFFSAQQKAFEEMRASGSTDRDAMKLKNEELTKQRDIDLKPIMTEEQYTKFQNEIVPSLRQRRNPKPGAQ